MHTVRIARGTFLVSECSHDSVGAAECDPYGIASSSHRSPTAPRSHSMWRRLEEHRLLERGEGSLVLTHVVQDAIHYDSFMSELYGGS